MNFNRLWTGLLLCFLSWCGGVFGQQTTWNAIITTSNQNSFSNFYSLNLGDGSSIPTTVQPLINSAVSGFTPFMAIEPNAQLLDTFNLGQQENGIWPINLTPPGLGQFLSINNISYDTAQFSGISLEGIAIAPDGTTAYLVNQGFNNIVSVSLPATFSSTITPIATGGSSPVSIALTPDGTMALVANYGSYDVSVISNLNTSPSVTTTLPLNFPNAPYLIGVNPNGQTAYVLTSPVLLANPSLSLIDLTANPPVVSATINLLIPSPNGMAITPDGTTIYLVGEAGVWITKVDLTQSPPVVTLANSSVIGNSIAITPDGKTAYIANQNPNEIIPIDLTQNPIAPQTAISLNNTPYYIVITPDQAPIASFTATVGQVGQQTAFDASASTSPVGSIQTYSWDFGDGNTQITTSPLVTHVYSTVGSYTVALTVTNTAGTSTTQFFTGQMLSNNGGASATTSQSIGIAPFITSINPNAGLPSGGIVSTITGVGFTGATAVNFGSISITPLDFTIISDTQIAVTVPAGSIGPVNVTVTGVNGAVSNVVPFTYSNNPTITNIAPSSGPAGTLVTLTGTGFNLASSINFGGQIINLSPPLSSDTSLSFSVPANASSTDTVVVTITNPTGTSSSAPLGVGINQFTYVASPTVDAVSPRMLKKRGGDVITLQGKGLSRATAVYFGDVPAASFTINSDNQITAISPPSLMDQVVHVMVVTPESSSPLTVNDTVAYVDDSEFAPSPPSQFRGKVVKNQFATQTDYVHILTWSPSSSTTVTSYVLLRNGQQIATISPSGPFIYEAHQQSKHKQVVYTLMAVDAEGFQSTPVTVTIP